MQKRCLILNCNNSHACGGLCRTHYDQQVYAVRTGRIPPPPLRLPKQPPKCLTDTCTRTGVTRGLCKKCYDASRRNVRSFRWAGKAKMARVRAVRLGLCTYSGCKNTVTYPLRACDSHRNRNRGRGGSVYRSLCAHLGYIRRGISTYRGMPFWDAWNPALGGSIKVGEKWIIQHIGDRPSDGTKWDLHIVNRSLGVVPENLQWIPRDQHKRAELINRVLIENQNLQIENKKLKEFIAVTLPTS